MVVDQHVRICEHAGEQAAGKPREAVGVDHAERVVDLAERAQAAQVVQREVDHRRADHAYRDGSDAVYVTRGRRNPHEAGDHAVHPGDESWLASREVVPHDPHQEGHGCAQIGIEDCRRGRGAGEVRVTAVEAVPAEPQ